MLIQVAFMQEVVSAYQWDYTSFRAGRDLQSKTETHCTNCTLTISFYGDVLPE